MCELLLASSASPIRLGEILDWAGQMEEYGVAGFGWGVAWLSEPGCIVRHRNLGRLRSDPSVGELANRTAMRVMVHLRRPSRLSTVQLADTQPFLADDGRFAFCHNGEFKRHEEYRENFAGRLVGKADFEVGFRLFEELSTRSTALDALELTATTLGGNANLAYLGNDGTLLARSGHHANRIWRFALGQVEIAATELHSANSSLFDLIFADALDRRRFEGTELIGGEASGQAEQSST